MALGSIADLASLGLSAEQILQRRSGIGGSDATILMGGNPEKIAKLWEEKTGRREPDDLSDVLCVQLGSYTEPFNAAWYQKTTGRKVICRNLAYIRNETPWLRANVDGMSILEGENNGWLWEAKHVSGWEDLEETVVPRYTPQVYHNMNVTRHDKGVLSILVGTSELRIFEFQANPMYLARLIERETEFWECVQQDCPPPEWMDIAPPPPVTDFKSVSMEHDPEWRDAAHAWLGSRELAQLFEKASKQIRAMIPPDVGEASGCGIVVKRSKNGSLLIREEKQKRRAS